MESVMTFGAEPRDLEWFQIVLMMPVNVVRCAAQGARLFHYFSVTHRVIERVVCLVSIRVFFAPFVGDQPSARSFLGSFGVLAILFLNTRICPAAHFHPMPVTGFTDVQQPVTAIRVTIEFGRRFIFAARGASSHRITN
jgi:hypothetical protein